MQVDIQKRPKTFVVMNPVAGTLEAAVVREKIQSILQAHDIPFEIYETDQESPVRQVVRDAVKHGFKLFLAAGGDGTISSVVSGLVNTNIPLVVVPTGTWNALARNLDIPLQIDPALELVFQQHRVRTIDAMRVEQEYYVLNVSAGVSSQTMKNVKREEKRRFGRLVDLWKGFTQMLGFQPCRFDIKIDGKPTVFHASELMVANIKILGVKSLQLDSDIHMDDGKLNVCRIYARDLRDYVSLFFSMLRGNRDRNWHVLCVEALHEVEINSNRKLPVQGDGDIIGRLPIKVKLCPKAVSIVTPTDSKT
jgi:diacylglycerol kinase (ATP)